MNKCCIDVCDRPQRSNRYCAAHYQQTYHHGRITKLKLDGPFKIVEYKKKGYNISNIGNCIKDNCQSLQVVKHMCWKHYQRMRKEMKNDISRSVKIKQL